MFTSLKTEPHQFNSTRTGREPSTMKIHHTHFFGVLSLLISLVLVEGPSEAVNLNPSWDQKINNAKVRFMVLPKFNGEAVQDRETGLVWALNQSLEPDTDSQTTFWSNAVNICRAETFGNRKGWRLAAIEEFLTLIDPTQSDPALPQGHPFAVNPFQEYWTASTVPGGNAENAYVVDLRGGGIISVPKTDPLESVWCVRGPGGYDVGH